MTRQSLPPTSALIFFIFPSTCQHFFLTHFSFPFFFFVILPTGPGVTFRSPLTHCFTPPRWIRGRGHKWCSPRRGWCRARLTARTKDDGHHQHTAPLAFDLPSLSGSFRCGPSRNVRGLRLAHTGRPSATTPAARHRCWREGNLKESMTGRFQGYPNCSLSMLTALPEAPYGVHIHASIMLACYSYTTGSEVCF